MEKLAEDFPSKTPENPWIKEQTNKQFLTSIKVSPLSCVWPRCPGCISARPYAASCAYQADHSLLSRLIWPSS